MTEQKSGPVLIETDDTGPSPDAAAPVPSAHARR